MFAELAVVGVFDLRKAGPISGACRGRKRERGQRRTLWKSYLLSWRTKDAKFECLNIRGRMDFVNSFMSYRGKSGVLSRQHAGNDGVP
jgi:hypothetical protein